MRGNFSSLKNAVVRLIAPGALALTVAVSVFSCAPADEDASYSADCVLPTDQKLSLTGRWYRIPIYISFKDGNFNSYELGLAMDAADAWNRFFTATQGVNVFDYGSRQAPRIPPTTAPTFSCLNTVVNTSQTSGYSSSLIVYKRTAWPTGYPTAAIAITSTCTNVASPVKALSNAMMEVNYQNYFASGKQVPDLTSIFTHEFGHMLGLDHSCATSYDSNSPTHPPVCSNNGLDQAYFNAVMYPSFSFKSDNVTGVPRRALNSNDQGRMNCLYGPNAL